MDLLHDYKYIIIALIIGLFIGWILFRSNSIKNNEFIGLKPLLDTVSNHTKIFLDARDNDEYIEEVDDVIPEKIKKEVTIQAEPQTLKPFQSRGEAECIRAAQEIFNVPFKKIHPKWLVNPKTGRRMEIDCYNDQLKIGIEYHGKQHYVFPNRYHKRIEDFNEQKERDIEKLNICDENGVYLITVPYTIPINRIKSYIEYYHPDRRAERLANGQTAGSSC